MSLQLLKIMNPLVDGMIYNPKPSKSQCLVRVLTFPVFVSFHMEKIGFASEHQ